MLNVTVPYEVNTVHSDRYLYPPTPQKSPVDSGRNSIDQPGSRRGSSIAAEDEKSLTLTDRIENAPPVIVFFSFLDKDSKKWAVEHHVAHNIRRNVPQGTTVARYHVPLPFAGEFGDDLTHAWALAQSLGVDDKVIEPLFYAIHEKRVTDLEGIRTIFDQAAGIDPLRFLREWGQQKVLDEKEDMDRALAHLDLEQHKVPSILVHGKYMVKLDTYSEDFSADRAVALVRDLLARKQ